MPPFIAGKRQRSSSPQIDYNVTLGISAKKRTLFDVADERPAGSLKANQEFLEGLGDSDSDTSLSDVSSVEFEDVTQQSTAKRRKLEHNTEDENEEIDWEDAVHQGHENGTPYSTVQPSGDLELTLDKSNPGPSFTNNQKKGPSKIERQIRVVTHCMHVQFLLWHNSLKSRFACDAKVQRILVDQLPPVVKKEVDTWRLASGLPQVRADLGSESSARQRARQGKRRKAEDVRSQRDWGKPAERQEKGAPNMSRGDPVIRLLKVLAAYWKKRFTITAPGLRKQGYKSLSRLEDEIASFKNDKHDPEEHGERISNLDEFRDHAKSCEGSSNVGVQLFVALLRGLGLEARLVASLQPVGFGWNKNEEAGPKEKRMAKSKPGANGQADAESATENSKAQSKPKPRKAGSNKRESAANGSKNTPVSLSDSSSSELSSPNLADEDGNDNESVIDVTPSTPRKRANMPYDRDLLFPTYWTEVTSPITHEIYPVDPFILTPAVATNPEHLAAFESRGAKADKAKQVFAYIIAYSPDGTAKDVTTRYLKKHMWPGRTKGVRLPVEKIPIYNSKGKIKHYEEYDWFKTVMSGYTRPDHLRTAVDDIEESKDLKAIKPEKREGAKAKEGTLQFYKTSADYILERHLRREEAIPPGTKPVKYFNIGKGDDSKDEPVFLRKDVIICRTSESWHKEGRVIKPHQHPMKMVPIRAVTLTRKREVEEAERDGGEKLKQGLYSWDQTEWVIPPPIEGGRIPKNAYGNMDCFVPTMVPQGAAHVPLRSTAKICKRLGIDFAEAVTGFEFGKQRAVPVITGVVVAEENKELVVREWERDEEERRRKEEGKRERLALGMWKKLLVGLRIIERVRDEYGADGEGSVTQEVNPFTNRNKGRRNLRPDEEVDGKDEKAADGKSEDMAGGFLADDAEGSDIDGGFLPGGDHHIDNESSPPPKPHPAQDLEIEHDTAVQKPNGVHTIPQGPPPNSEYEVLSESYDSSFPFKPTGNKRRDDKSSTLQSKKISTRKSSPRRKEANGDTDVPVEESSTRKRASRGKKRSSSKRDCVASTTTPRRRAPRRKATQAVESPYFELHSNEDEHDGE
ncbi:MAG: hypothetical protein Q9179_006117 [Wetmoreana sp. 5 TL-2023]